MIEIIGLPFVAALVLTGIHVYFGLQVIERQVIFVDLALAQVASLGSVVAFVLGFPFHTVGSYAISLGVAMVGAAILTFTKFRRQAISQEVIIGIIYAEAAALSVLVLNSAPSEAAHLKEMLVGNLLFVDAATVLKLTGLYAGVAVLLILAQRFRRTESGKFFWDFLFYASFAVVVTSSVELAGVFLVFAYLIIPSAAAILLTANPRRRLFIGWTVGVVGSLGGFAASVVFDLPTGAAIVVVLGLILVLVGAGRWIMRICSLAH